MRGPDGVPNKPAKEVTFERSVTMELSLQAVIYYLMERRRLVHDSPFFRERDKLESTRSIKASRTGTNVTLNSFPLDAVGCCGEHLPSAAPHNFLSISQLSA